MSLLCKTDLSRNEMHVYSIQHETIIEYLYNLFILENFVSAKADI